MCSSDDDESRQPKVEVIHAIRICFCQEGTSLLIITSIQIQVEGIVQFGQYPWALLKSLHIARSSKMPDILPLPPPTSTTLCSSIILPSLAQIFSELLQNSLDAGATKVECYVNMAKGSESLRVEDDGTGISKDGLAEIGKRFRTSKEIHEGGLGPVGSYGFRGEGKPGYIKVFIDTQHCHSLSIYSFAFPLRYYYSQGFVSSLYQNSQAFENPVRRS